MIFKTFDSDNGFLSKIGVLNKSFAEIGKAFGDAINLSIEGIFDDTIGDQGFFKNLKNNLTTQVDKVSDLYSKLFITKNDVKPFKITDFSVYEKDSSNILKKLLLQIRIKKDLSFVMINPLNSKIFNINSFHYIINSKSVHKNIYKCT